MSRLARVLAALLLASTATCGGDSTSFFLRVEGADGATQLEVRGVRDGQPWFGPERRPEPEGTPLSGEQTLRIRFNTPPGAPVLVEVDALANGVPIARGSAEATPRKGEEVELRIGLAPVTEEPRPDGGTDGGEPDAGEPDGGDPDAGQPDAGEPDGGEPDAGEPDAGAPDAGGGVCNGCTQGESCLPGTTEAACGAGGEACQACTGDAWCVEGQCQRCTPQTCPEGCCDKGVCRVPSDMTCGSAGEACSRCTNGNTCTNGDCLCGNSICINDSTCFLGACI